MSTGASVGETGGTGGIGQEYQQILEKMQRTNLEAQRFTAASNEEQAKHQSIIAGLRAIGKGQVAAAQATMVS